VIPQSAVHGPLHADLLALLGACRAAPADDMPRLVLADWLDENAEAAGLPSADDARERAALLRVQVELAHPTCDTDRVAQLRGAESQLLARNAARWLGDLRNRLDQLHGRQPFGFARGVGQSGPPFDPLAPGHTWRFTRGLLTIDLASDGLTGLELAGWFTGPLAAWVEEAGVTIDGLSALEHLTVTDALRPYLGVRYTLGAPPRPTMRLNGARPEVLHAKRCRQLLKCPNFGLVRSLTVHSLAVEAGALRHLPDANIAGLRWLSIRAPVGDAGAAYLAATPLINLSALDVVGCEIGADGLKLIANSPHLQQLVALSAFRNRFGCGGLAALAASPLAERLHRLEIQNNGIGDRGAAALAESPLLERLSGPGLNLSMNPIADAGAAALAASPHMEPFTDLILRDCRVADRGARALAGSPRLANLAYLDLWHNRVADRGARALAASAHLGNLRELSLRDNSITPRSATVLRARYGDRVKV
jgi:uncharacterized protein (TIGR02996 family)